MLRDADTTAAPAAAFSGSPARLPSDHPRVASGRIGVLLTNLGTPDATDYWSIRRYLKEFRSDRRVIETPRLLWWPVLNLVILTTRPGRKGKDYASIWNKERDESPLKTITRGQSDRLAQWVAAGGLGVDAARISVDWAMRYGNPSIAAALDRMQKQGCERILVVPLYPQYAAATTATACDKTFEALKTMRWQPTVRFSPPYHDDPAYISSLMASTRRSLAALDFVPEMLLASFHGVPQAYLDKGDPYHCHCVKTWRLLREAMGKSAEEFPMSFQSRFGPTEWLKPYTDTTVKALAQRGVKRLAVLTPGFSADCLETLEEIGVENRHYFIENGGEAFAAVPCLNDSDEGMAVITQLVRRELSGWV